MLVIQITQMDNEAFSSDCAAETIRIIRQVAVRIERGDTVGNCIDMNGHKVGEWSYDEPEKDEDDDDHN